VIQGGRYSSGPDVYKCEVKPSSSFFKDAAEQDFRILTLPFLLLFGKMLIAFQRYSRLRQLTPPPKGTAPSPQAHPTFDLGFESAVVGPRRGIL